MKTTRLLSLVALLSAASALHAHEGCTCSSAEAPDTAKPAATVAPVKTQSADEHAGHGADKNAAEAPKRHPLKGVVVDVLAARSALLVKHEEIPGVMKAMTMLLKVDEAGLVAAKKGDAITGFLVRKTDGWWLEGVTKAAN